MLGAVARIPEFQFLDKNSKFKSGGRTFKSFKMLARAVRTDGLTGRAVVLAQVESENFKVRKSERKSERRNEREGSWKQ